ncbi:hypothetical protein ASD04_10960 [Devosia sp. Root436]|uniref:hypothetical protein n=1 Tax=Devosia sp. Root436 TaxID=1736537 RepID=UPI0006F9E7BA|nr:hypothetical protein [Devosia sp. Root436]KQX38138.1 hypothetical protein ASD04_10960 [Devosia sp. Root436]
MPFPPFAPSVYFDEADLAALIAEFSERVRRNPDLRPAMDRLVGNRWEEAEAAASSFLQATLFLERRPNVDGDWLAKSIRTLDGATIDGLADILLDCALVVLPLHSAAVVAEVSDALARLLKDVVIYDGVMRQRLLLKVQSRLAAGALMSGI